MMKTIKFLDNSQVIAECGGEVVITASGTYMLTEEPEYIKIDFLVEASYKATGSVPVMNYLDLQEIQYISTKLQETNVENLKVDDLVFADEEERIRVFPHEITLSDLLHGEVLRVARIYK